MIADDPGRTGTVVVADRSGKPLYSSPAHGHV